MKQSRVLSAVGVALFLAGSLLGEAVYARSSAADSTPASSKTKKKSSAGAKGSGAGQMKILPGSAETTKERNDRLKRECKGRVNAGACAGFTG